MSTCNLATVTRLSVSRCAFRAACLTFLVTALAPLHSQAQTTAPVFDFVESGLLCPTQVVGRREEPGTVSGEIRLIDADTPVAVHTDQVPMEIGAEFGIRMQLDQGFGTVNATVTVTHPPIPPSGQSVETWGTVLSDTSPSIVAFTFETYDELQAGIWSYRIEAGGRVLIERSFNVTDTLDLSYQMLCEAPTVTS